MSELKLVSLFSGIGGLDFGFEAAGFETAVAVELDKHCCSTLRLNRNWPVIEGDINTISSKQILDTAGVIPGEVDCLIGGPPCQPFSKSGYWSKGSSLRLDDPRADTLVGYLRVLRDVRPKSFLIENVTGLAFKGKDEGLQFLLDGIARVNQETKCSYNVSYRVINCAEYGVPQIRERIFLIGSREGMPFNFPEPEFASSQEMNDAQDLFFRKEPFRTAWDALGDLPPPTPEETPNLIVGGKWADLLPSIPEGENYLWHTERRGGLPLFGWRTRYWSFLLKLAKNLPSWTIQAQPGSAVGPFHWENRKLSFKEMCRLQTFPDNLSINASRTETQRMLGNAVPSLIAEILAVEIRSQILGEPIAQREPLLLPPKRVKFLGQERVEPVPDKYRHLLGEHEAHPGTGKGRRAAAIN